MMLVQRRSRPKGPDELDKECHTNKFTTKKQLENTRQTPKTPEKHRENHFRKDFDLPRHFTAQLAPLRAHERSVAWKCIRN